MCGASWQPPRPGRGAPRRDLRVPVECGQGGIVAAMPDQIRLLVVEDVPQVAQYIRGLLNSQTVIKLLDVVTDGNKVLGLAQELRPDVILIDALLQGRLKGMQLVAKLHEGGNQIPVIVLTVPQHPVQANPALGIHAVLPMPFTGYELVTRIQQSRQVAADADASGG